MGRFQTVAVFGAGSDIASATLRELVREGPFTAVLYARDPDALETSYLESAGVTVERAPFDAVAFETHVPLIDSLFDRHDDVDLALIAFGVLGDQDEAERDPGAAAAIVQTNFTGGVTVLTGLVGRMVAQGHGTIVVLSSLAAVRARRSNYIYGSAKAGLDAFAQGLQQRLAGTGVEVMIVRPGFVRTKMTHGLKAMPLAIGPEAVATAIVTGLRKGSAVVWAPAAMRLAALVLRHAPRRVVSSL